MANATDVLLLLYISSGDTVDEIMEENEFNTKCE